MILIIIIFFIIIYSYNNNKEKFIDDVPITFDTLKQNIYNIYTNDVNAIINLSKIANQIQNILTFNNINMKGELNLYQYNNNNFLSFTKSQNTWTISNPQNNNDLLLSLSQDVMGLKSDGSGVVISKSLAVDLNLNVSNISNLNLITANKISIGTNNNNTLNINGDMIISNALNINGNININGSLEIPGSITINNNLSINSNDFIQLYNDTQKLLKQTQINGMWKSGVVYIDIYNDRFTVFRSLSPTVIALWADLKIINYNTSTMEIITLGNSVPNTIPKVYSYLDTNGTIIYNKLTFTRLTSLV